MIAAPAAPRQYTYATVPLRCEYLRQAALFEAAAYPLPKVMPADFAVVYDADDWTHNFKRGEVLRYNYFTGAHTIHFDSMAEGDFKGWEIIKAKRIL